MKSFLLLCGLVWLVPLVTCSYCDIDESRIDCKRYTQSECVSVGCCWNPVNPNPSNLPYCFYQNGGSPVCNDNSETKIDCGYDGIDQNECLGRNCCWDPVNEDNGNIPYCYQSNPIMVGYNVTTVTAFNNHSSIIDLVVVDPDSQMEYGDPIPNLKVLVNMETPNRLHIKIVDSDNERWELPGWLIPRPGVTIFSGEPDYEFGYDVTPFGFYVLRRSTSEVLFNTSVPAGKSWNGLQFKDQFLQLTTQLDPEASIYGLQESSQSAGFKLTQKTYTLWNHDTPAANPDINLYGSHPFYLQMNNGKASGVLLLNSNGMDVDYAGDHLTYNVIGGVFDFYFFTGPTPDDVVKQYNQVIGLPHMQPYWSFGFHQCRYGMPDLQYVEEVVANYSAAGIPLDTMWSDIDYMDEYKDFTWDPTNYPLDGVQSFVEQLHSQNQQYVIILDPGILNDDSYFAYNDLISNGAYIRDTYGDPFVGQVWPGYTIFPDFMNENGVQYWSDELTQVLNGVPIDGFWVDMNEAANFCSGECTDGTPIPLSSTTCGCATYEGEYFTMGGFNSSEMYNAENPPYAIDNQNSHAALNDKAIDANAYNMLDSGEKVLQYDAHNIFGLTEARATKMALEGYYSKRSFVLTRSSFPSSGKWTAHWTGDNASQWPDLYYSIVGMLNFNILGIPMIGSDICGFLDDTTEELCSRWIEVGAFYPFSRNHDDIHSVPQELYRWPQVSSISAYILKVRYSLLPVYYTLNYHSSVDGSPIIRPLFFKFPDDLGSLGVDTQFLVGDSLMVVPVITEGADTVDGYFPPGVYYDFYSGGIFSNSTFAQHIVLDSPLDNIPLFFLGGSIIPQRSSPLLTTHDTRMNSFIITVALDENNQANGDLFMDDGTTLDYITESTLVSFNAVVSSRKGQLTSTVAQANYSGEYSTDVGVVQILGITEPPQTISLNSQRFTGTQSYDPVLQVLTLNSLEGMLSIDNEFTISWTY